MTIEQNEARAEIARQVEEYIKRGGKITVLPHQQLDRVKLPVRMANGGYNAQN